MFKKIVLTSFLFFSLFSFIYPSQKENTKLLDYCYSLEKILFRNSLQTKKNISWKHKSITNNIAKFGLDKTKGALINKMIDQYKHSKKSFIINFVPNKLYCYAGYWIEIIKPGTFESIFYKKGNKAIHEFKDFKNEVDRLLNEYEAITEEFNNFF